MSARDNRFEPTPFGNYTLLRRIGQGGMSEVFLARPLDPRRHHERFALKRLLPDLARAPDFVRLFEQERQLAARLKHPNVVRVVDGGVVDDRCFMVIEYVEGLDGWKVTRRLARQIETLPLDQVLWIVTQALAGLAYLHELRDERGASLGIVHRDVSPSNILLSRRGEVKVGDFGIALIRSAEIEQQRRQRLRGKIRYLSPEQIRNQPLDARSDLFAVGVLLAELIIGRTPFRGQTDIALLLNIRDVRLHLAEDLDERTPAELRQILLQALAREPRDRPPRASAMRDRLLAFAAATGLRPAAAPLAATVERLLRPGDVGDEDVLRDTLTPWAHAPVGPREIAVVGTGGAPSRPVTTYRVRWADGRESPALSYAEVVEQLLGGHVAATDQVAVDDAPFRPVHALPDLLRHLPLLTPTTTRIDGPGVPDRHGLFQDDAVPTVFLLLARHRETGLLVADAGSVRKEVYLVDGHPIYASSNLGSELLGEYLVRKGVLNRVELELALAMLPRYEGHLGDTLVALELLDPLTLFSHITEQVREKVLELYGWQDGSWSFFRGVVCEKRAFPLSSSAPELLHEGIHRSRTDEQLAAWWTTVAERVVAPVPQAEPPPDWWPLTEAERHALVAVDRPLKAGDALRRLQARAPQFDRPALLRALHLLLAAGLARPTD
ncbi:MAG: protein kinase [Deltaproteobacteria bacterium]|nr:protein kinase [Deltaproteobacteria bacterium]